MKRETLNVLRSSSGQKNSEKKTKVKFSIIIGPKYKLPFIFKLNLYLLVFQRFYFKALIAC